MEYVAEGSFGTVYKKNGRAYKLFERTLQCSEVLREISILRELDNAHPNVVHLYDIYYRENKLCIEMDLYEYDLSHFIHYYDITPEMKHDIMYTLLHVVDFLHAHNIIHRDVKTDNCLLKNGSVFLCDFGHAKYFEGGEIEPTHTGEVCTRMYRAPEIVAKKSYGFTCDEWALGVVFIELLNDKLLDIKSSKKMIGLIDTIREVCAGKNPEYAHVLKGLLTKNRYKRMKAGEALMYFDEEPIDTKPFTPKKFPDASEYETEDSVARYTIDKMFSHLAVEEPDVITYDPCKLEKEREFLESNGFNLYALKK